MNNVSLYRIVQYMLDTVLRKPKTLAWLKVSVTYLQRIVIVFDERYLEYRRIAHISPQVCYLEKYLQIKFASNSISIRDIENVERYSIITGEDVEQELFISDDGTYFYSTSEIENSRFVVQYSPAVEGYTPSIKAAVQKYKLPGIKFLLQVI